MADLLPIPAPRLVTSEGPQDRVSGADVARSGYYLGSGLDQLSEGLDRAATPLAEQAGREAAAAAVVSRDANGNPIVLPPHTVPILSPHAAAAYDHSVVEGMQAKGQTATATALFNLRQQHLNDPAGFQIAADSYIADIKGRYGSTAIGQAMVDNATQLAGQHAIGISRDNAQQQVANDKQSILTQITDQQNTMAALARQAGTNTPAFLDAAKKLEGYYTALGQNPSFGTPAAVIASEKNKAFSTFQAEAVIGSVDRVFASSGRAAAEKLLDDTILNDPSKALSDPERRQLVAFGHARIDTLAGANRGQIAANRSAVNDVVEKFRAGAVIPDAVLDGLDQAARATGDDESHLRIASMRMNGAIRGQDGLSPQQSLALQFPRGMPGAAPGASGYGATNAPYTAPLDQPGEGYVLSPRTMFTFLKSQGASDNEALVLTGAAGSESSFNPRAIHDRSAAGVPQGYGLFGHNVGRLDLRGTDWQHQASAALQELRSRPESAAVNAAQTPDDLAVAQVRYEQPRGFTSANPRGADNFTGRLNTIRYFAQMAGEGGGGMAAPAVATAPGTMPFTADAIASNPFLASDWVAMTAHDTAAREAFAEKAGGTIERALDLGITPDPDNRAAFYQVAGQNPVKFGEQAQRIASKAAGLELANQVDSLPAGAAQATLDAFKADAAQRHDVLTMAAADFAQKRHDAAVTGLRDDPVGTAVQKRWAPPPPDLNPADPATFAPAIAARANIVRGVAARTGDPEQSVLGAADVPGVKALLAQGSTEQKLALLSPFAALPQPVQATTLQRLGVADGDTRAFAAAGSVYRADPQTARDILDGSTQLRDNPRYAPKPADVNTAIAASMPANDFGAGITSTVQSAALALYAKASAVAKDTDGVLVQPRWNDAVNRVTGGVIDWRGSKVIVPRYGMSEGEFRDVMRGLTDADLAGSRTADGTPLPASALQPRMFGGSQGWRLQSYGDGTYRVFSGDDAARSYLRTDVLDAREGNGLFLLDLRAKAAGPR